MQLKWLKVFCDVVGHRSFSRGAGENDISQSGASQIVSQLEEHLELKLIDRSKRPFVLTPEGEIYYAGCRKIVRQLTALEEEVRTLHHDVDGRVVVASIYSVGFSHMALLVQKFLALHTNANVRLEYQHPSRVYELVENDEVDLGLVSYPKSTRSIGATPWREEPMVLACAPTHPLAEKSRLVASDLHGLKFIGFDRDLNIRRRIDQILASKQVSAQVVMEFDNIETLKRAVEIDAGVSLLPSPTVEREVHAQTLVARQLDDLEFTRPVGIIYRQGKVLGKTAQRFLDLLQRSSDKHALEAI